jgi:hypothetical protein
MNDGSLSTGLVGLNEFPLTSYAIQIDWDGRDAKKKRAKRVGFLKLS